MISGDEKLNISTVSEGECAFQNSPRNETSILRKMDAFILKKDNSFHKFTHKKFNELIRNSETN